MIIDKTHRSWIAVTVAILALLTASYVVYARHSPGGPAGGSLPGLAYGILGSALMVFAGLIAVRKRFPRWRIGSAQTWLRGHIWLGLLSVPTILFHAGFRWGGLLEQALLAVLGGILLSGLFGLIVQHLLTRSLTARVPRETFFDQIPHVCAVLQVEGDVAVARLCGPLPIEPDLTVATKERLERLDVAGRDPLVAVYRQLSPGGETPRSDVAVAAGPSPQLQDVKEPRPEPHSPARAARTPPAKDAEPGALSTAETLAAMKGARKAAPAARSSIAEPALIPAAEGGAPSEPAKALSTAEKLALMKAGKKTPTTAPEKPTADAPQAPATPAKALSTAEKLALMKAGKKATPSTTENPTTDAPPTPAPASDPAPATPAKALSTAEKLALMKAGKKATPSTTEKPTADAPPAPAPAADPAPTGPTKAMSTAEKLAMMKAGKKAPTAVAPKTSEPPATAPATAPAPAAKAAAVARPKPARAADDQWKAACPVLTRLYLEDLRAFLGRRSGGSHRLSSPAQTRQIFVEARNALPVEMHDALDRLLDLCDERWQLETQLKIHHWLHGWLALHVPLSLALLVLGVAHAAISLYY